MVNIQIPIYYVGIVPIWFFLIIFVIYWIWIRKRINVKILAPISQNEDKKEFYKIVKSARASLSDTVYKFKDKEYMLDLKFSILDKRDNPTLHFLLGSIEPLGISKINDKIKSGGMLKEILETNAYGKLLQGYKDKTYITIIIVLVVVMGLVIAFSMYNMNVMNGRIIELSELMYNITSSPDWIVK